MNDSSAPIAFRAVFNFRDLGALPLTAGGTTRSGQLFRSGSPDHMSQEEAEALVHRTGLRTVIDLRGNDEVPVDLGPLATRVIRHHFPMWDDELEADEQAHLFAEPVAFLTRNYARLTDRFVEQLVRAVSVLGEAGSWPALVHCAGGKDRTGLLVAMLLESVGVEEEAIVLDYMASEPEAQRAFAWRHRDGARNTNARRRTIDVVQAPALRARLEAMQARYGSSREFLAQHGAAPEAFDVIRSQLVGGAAEARHSPTDGVPAPR